MIKSIQVLAVKRIYYYIEYGKFKRIKKRFRSKKLYKFYCNLVTRNMTFIDSLAYNIKFYAKEKLIDNLGFGKTLHQKIINYY